MTHNLDLHDTFSVIVPGACALCLSAYFYCDDWEEFIKLLSDLSVGGSIVFLAFSYICGEFLQALGQFLVKPLFRSVFEEEPLLWIVPEVVNNDEGSKEEYSTKLLSKEECRKIMEYLKSECNCENISKEQMGTLFSHVKIKVYADDVCRTECIKMLTKANFYSTMTVLFGLVPVVYFAVSELCEKETTSLSFPPECICFACQDCYINSDVMPFSWAISWGLAVICACRYRFFNVIYNRILLSSYLSLSEKEKKANS